MNNVFPESLNNLPEDPYEAIKVLENYIRYMTERIDFALTSGLKVGGRNLTQLSQEVTGIETTLEAVNGEIVDLGTALDTKVDKVSGKGLSTNDYTTAEKTKLSGIATGANKTTVDSARSSTSTNPLQNKVIDAALTTLTDATTFWSKNYTVATYGGTIYARRFGRVISITGRGLGGTSPIPSATTKTLVTLDSTYRPSVNANVNGATDGFISSSVLRVEITTGGAVQVRCSGADNGVFNICYVK